MGLEHAIAGVEVALIFALVAAAAAAAGVDSVESEAYLVVVILVVAVVSHYLGSSLDTGNSTYHGLSPHNCNTHTPYPVSVEVAHFH